MRTPMGPSMQMALFMVELLGEVPWRTLDAAWDAWIGRTQGARRLARFEDAGALLVDHTTKGLDRLVRITESGRSQAHGGGDPEQAWQRPWDGQWRMVFFDVPEKARERRARLQRLLRRARFGYLQDSVWITPDPLDGLSASLRRSERDGSVLSFVEARPCVGSTDAELVAGAWDFPRLHQLYGEHAELLRLAPSRQASLLQRRGWFQREWQAWRRAFDADPLLPEMLWPTGYRGRRAWEARRDRLRRVLTA